MPTRPSAPVTSSCTSRMPLTHSSPPACCSAAWSASSRWSSAGSSSLASLATPRSSAWRDLRGSCGGGSSRTRPACAGRGRGTPRPWPRAVGDRVVGAAARPAGRRRRRRPGDGGLARPRSGLAVRARRPSVAARRRPPVRRAAPATGPGRLAGLGLGRARRSSVLVDHLGVDDLLVVGGRGRRRPRRSRWPTPRPAAACARSYICSETRWKAVCSRSVLARMSSASSPLSGLVDVGDRLRDLRARLLVDRLAEVLELLLGVVGRGLAGVAGLGQLAQALVLLGVRLGVGDHVADLGVAQAGARLDLDLLLLARAEVLRATRRGCRWRRCRR